jgi:probable HAF family extracellular repeat protein
MFPIHHGSRWAWLAAAVMCGGIPPAAGQSAIVMEPLGGLPVGDVGSTAYHVSADGTVVVGVANRHGFRWVAGGGLEDFGNNTSARRVTANGAVVVGTYGDRDSSRPFRWTAATGVVGLGTLPGFSESYPTAVSADGAIVVGVSRIPYDIYEEPCEGRSRVFRWTAATEIEDLGVLPDASCSFLGAVSVDGKVVLGQSGGHAFRWTPEEGMEEIGVYAVRGVSADGTVVVGDIAGAQGFRWTAESGIVELGGGPAFTSIYVNDVSADGRVVVGSGRTRPGGPFHAFRWTAATGAVDLGVLPGGSGSGAQAVSLDGAVIVGFTITDDGQRAFRWSSATGMVDVGALSPAGDTYLGGVSVDGRVVVGQSGGRAFRAYVGRPRIEGTDGPDQLLGGAGADVIAGGLGADVMTGFTGKDTYYVDTPLDVVREASGEGADTVRSLVTYTLPAEVERLILLESAAISGTGNALANALIGNSANNTLNGKRGNDTLKGKAGRDRFVFDTVPGTSTNYDTIADFRPADDSIRLENSVFTGLPTVGTLAAAAFATGTAATTAAHRILYDPATGNVRYDPDGTGPTAAVRFAVLATKPAVTRANFYVR